MSSITPAVKELVVRKPVEETRAAILKQLQAIEGRIIKSDEAYIECDFVSLLLSRIIGELWVPGTILPNNSLISKFSSKWQV
jgi:hypothetical protein